MALCKPQRQSNIDEENIHFEHEPVNGSSWERNQNKNNVQRTEHIPNIKMHFFV